jgi:hypothetical protein
MKFISFFFFFCGIFSFSSSSKSSSVDAFKDLSSIEKLRRGENVLYLTVGTESFNAKIIKDIQSYHEVKKLLCVDVSIGQLYKTLPVSDGRITVVHGIETLKERSGIKRLNFAFQLSDRYTEVVSSIFIFVFDDTRLNITGNILRSSPGLSQRQINMELRRVLSEHFNDESQQFNGAAFVGRMDALVPQLTYSESFLEDEHSFHSLCMCSPSCVPSEDTRAKNKADPVFTLPAAFFTILVLAVVAAAGLGYTLGGLMHKEELLLRSSVKTRLFCSTGSSVSQGSPISACYAHSPSTSSLYPSTTEHARGRGDESTSPTASVGSFASPLTGTHTTSNTTPATDSANSLGVYFRHSTGTTSSSSRAGQSVDSIITSKSGSQASTVTASVPSAQTPATAGVAATPSPPSHGPTTRSQRIASTGRTPGVM